MSFDHWLIRDFKKYMRDIPAGLIAYGRDNQLIEAHFAMLAHGLDFTSYAAGDLPNPFVSFVPRKAENAGHHLDDPRQAGGRPHLQARRPDDLRGLRPRIG